MGEEGAVGGVGVDGVEERLRGLVRGAAETLVGEGVEGWVEDAGSGWVGCG